MRTTSKRRLRGLGGLKKKRRVQIIIAAFVALASSATLIGYALKDGINFFRSPTETLAEQPPESEVFRLGGLVKEGSIRNAPGVRFHFVVTDGANEIPVHYVGDSPRPDLFTEGAGTIATGRLVGGTFEAAELLAKHDETYTPREVVNALEEQGIRQAPGS